MMVCFYGFDIVELMLWKVGIMVIVYNVVIMVGIIEVVEMIWLVVKGR